MVYRKKYNCQKVGLHSDKNRDYDFANLSIFKVALKSIFSVWISEKQSSLNGDNQAAPLMVQRQPAIDFPGGQSPFRLHCFSEIQI